jgi:hypothetical protein
MEQSIASSVNKDACIMEDKQLLSDEYQAVEPKRVFLEINQSVVSDGYHRRRMVYLTSEDTIAQQLSLL